jgi:hypothetical protein
LIVVSVWTGAELCILLQYFSSDPTIAFAIEIKDVFLTIWVSGAAAGGDGRLIFSIEWAHLKVISEGLDKIYHVQTMLAAKCQQQKSFNNYHGVLLNILHIVPNFQAFLQVCTALE